MSTADGGFGAGTRLDREADSYSWAAIAAMLGVSKQTAQARYSG